MTETDKIIQDLRLENDRLQEDLESLRTQIREQEKILAEVRDEADRLVKEREWDR